MIKIYKLKNNKVEDWKNWLDLLNSQLNLEAIESLKEEGATFEYWTIFRIGEDYYTAGAGDGKLPANPDREINKKHKAMKKECFDGLVESATSIDLTI